MRFSERYGHKEVRQALQKESMDSRLRNLLWNVLNDALDHLLRAGGNSYVHEVGGQQRRIIYALWVDHYGRTWDSLKTTTTYDICESIRSDFLSESEWFEVYDLLEFTAEQLVWLWNNGGTSSHPDWFIERCNDVLAKERSAWRFVGTKLAEITSEDEIRAIEGGLKDAAPLGGVRTHLHRALELYSDRGNPNYRNSIAESIHAVESLACTIAGDPKATLGRALDVIEKRSGVDVHEALKSAFGKLYGYTSDEDGIRHKMLEEDRVGQAEAQYMLVACSAFVSYLVSKAADAGIGLNGG